MSESSWRTDVVNGLNRLDAHAVENPALPGTPDVNYVEGWLELKWERNWPARSPTVVKCEHYSPQQRIYHRKRWGAGGQVYLLWKIGVLWLLFEGHVAARVVGKVPREELEQESCWNHCGTTAEAVASLCEYLASP